MGYGPTAALQRGHSETFTTSLDFRLGVATPNALGIRYPLEASAYFDKELLEVRAYHDGYLKGKNLPTLPELARVVLCLSTPDTYQFMADMPLSRLAYAPSAPGDRIVTRNLVWNPRLIDTQRSYLYVVGAQLRKDIILEFIYAR